MSIAETLAERIASVRYEALPPDAVHWASVAILDTVGCTLAGAGEPCARIVARVTASGGPCLVFGTTQRVAPLDAALINGTASHALDFDDCSNTLGGHPSAPMLPALFALAETRAVDGRAFVAAYVAGWETETSIARGINFHHYEKGCTRRRQSACSVRPRRAAICWDWRQRSPRLRWDWQRRSHRA